LSISDRTATNVLNDLESFFFVNRDIVGSSNIAFDVFAICADLAGRKLPVFEKK
jgi:hypothetical protein